MLYDTIIDMSDVLDITQQFIEDLTNSQRIRKLVLDETFAAELYSAMCNIQYTRKDLPKTHQASLSWRSAAGLVADLRKPKYDEDYLDWYLRGAEGMLTVRVKDELELLGWTANGYRELSMKLKQPKNIKGIIGK
jgi:hypothetical protein